MYKISDKKIKKPTWRNPENIFWCMSWLWRKGKNSLKTPTDANNLSSQENCPRGHVCNVKKNKTWNNTINTFVKGTHRKNYPQWPNKRSSRANIHCMYCRQGRGIFKAFAQTSYNLKKKYAGLYKVLLAENKNKKFQFIKSHKTSV